MPDDLSHLGKRFIAGFLDVTARLGHRRTEEMGKIAASGEKIAAKGPRSLANRILLLQFVWALIVYVLVIAAMWYAANSVIESSLRNQAEGWVVKLDEMGIPFYVSSSPDTLKDSINDLRNFSEVLGVRYLDASGENVIVEYRRRGVENEHFRMIDPALIERVSAKVQEQGKYFEFESGTEARVHVVAPLLVKSIASDGLLNFSLDNTVREKKEVIGYISIILDYSAATRQLNRNLSYASAIIAILMFLAAIVGRVMIRWALRPLLRLQEPLSRLANGEIDVTVESSGDREIVQIGRALNTTIGALRERDETLRRMANHDSLTGLVNRKHFIELLEEELARIGEQKVSSALFFFDLDRFKHINDTYGHAAGDRLLVQIADILRKRLRDGDVIARFGGDEFVALVRNVNRKSAQDIGAALVGNMQDFTFYEGVDALKIHFSVGIAMITDGRATPHHYLKQADMAVHEAKSQGRNRYFMYQPDISSREEDYDSGWYERLKEAIANEQFRFYFQPLTGLRGQTARIYEVLLRLPDARHGVLVPGGFFPAMERFGLMPELDRYVVCKAFEMLEEVHDEEMVLSVNCSGHIFNDDTFITLVEELLAGHKVKPQQIIFEVSEQVAVRHLERLRPAVQKLSAMGLRFAIDDFGAGFASFSYLKQFPVHCLKIHGALIERVALDPVDKITITSIVSMAKELGMETVAKFVPNDETLLVLREIGVDYAQGDYLGEPEPGFDRQPRRRLSVVK
ncbi:MAG TPA: EAL domain-containing protein [Gammaproteobacteria bacterium]